MRAPRNLRSGEYRTTPTLMRSPRSTSGTTRRTVYWNALRSATLGLLDPGLGIREALGEEAADLVALAGEPGIRHGSDCLGRRVGGDAVQPRIGIRDRPRA